MTAASPAADWHSHWLPPTLLRLLEHRTTAPCIQRIGGAPHLTAGRRSRRLEDVSLDLDARRDLLDRAGITWQLLSLSPLWNIDNLPPAEALPLVRSFNDDTCRAVADSPLLFAGLASLPLLDLKASCDELRRARRGGLRGVILPAEAFGTLRQARRLEPILRTANELDAHVFVHPGYLRRHDAPRCKPDNWWARTIVLEAQHQLGAAMLTLTSTPLLDDYPNILVQVANLGGGLPFYLERMRAVEMADAAGEPAEARSEPGFDMRRIVVDSASFGSLGIGLARRALGADKVVLGTDMPVFDAVRGTACFRRRD